MTATAVKVPLHEFAADLARQHLAAPRQRLAAAYGKKLKRHLNARLESMVARVAALPSTVHVQFVGLDWLDQNQHIIRGAVDQIASDLPRGYVRKLPAIMSSTGDGELRVKAISESIIERAVLPLDVSWIEQFLTLYQRELALSLGELWALPTLLRAEIVEILCDTVDAVLDLANAGADESLHAPVAANLSACVISLRTLAATDWLKFVERQSAVERILENDPSGSYPSMVPESRNHYREHVERLARRLGETELAIAETALKLSQDAPGTASTREHHVGYYLIDHGTDRLKAALRGKPIRHKSLRRRSGTLNSWAYLLAIGLPTAASIATLSGVLAAADIGAVSRGLLMILAIVPALTIWTEIVNWLLTQIIPPRVLPRLDFSRAIPGACTTVVAIPCMLTSVVEIDRLIDTLETNYLGNIDKRLTFVLLSDYTDADNATLDEDAALLLHAKAGIDTLNARYQDAARQAFALLHRERLWNETSGIWMGWERKRGKIAEFNSWLLGADDTNFVLLHGQVEALRKAQYVITLDADNQLLPGVASELIGALAHPLNRPKFDAASGRFVAGYTVIQPRVELHPASANRTVFSRLMSGDVGIDLYHHAVSEAYQDFFGEGIYAGKGIYDVRAFSRSVEGIVPDNAVLSHDLLEGILGRAALASDIVVLENASPNLTAELQRQHRWIRGDWQLLPWLIPIGGAALSGRVDLLGKWKLFDNLRRSLLPASLLALFLLGWLFLPENVGAWTLAVAAVPGLTIIYSLAGDIRRSPLRWGTLRSTLIRLSASNGKKLGQMLVNLAVLPVVAYSTLDAIIRTLSRLLITHRNLLEWTPSAQSDWETLGTTLVGSYRRMIAAPVTGSFVCMIAIASDPVVLWPALFGAAWLGAPLLMWFMARETEDQFLLLESERAELRKLARRTWQFYERFVGPETHWLPPDNYQEAPKVALAERTSPTNIGLFLISAVAAYDLNYFGAMGLLTRIDGTTDTLLRMRRFRGHLFNWYSTRDLSVLEPAYVSTVDSGNLMAALLICRSALLEIEQTSPPHLRAPAALGDIVANIEEVLSTNGDQGDGPEAANVLKILTRIRQCVADTPKDATQWNADLANVSDILCAELDHAVLRLAEHRGLNWNAERISTLRTWINQLRHESTTLQTEIADRLSVRRAADESRELLALRDRLLARIDKIVAATDFSFLFDANRQLFHIGYNNTTGELDASYYDLLASEARTASLIAIAKGDVPISHWVHLGRPLRRVGGMRVVLSWSATAFEYLMPRLFMETPAHGLLDTSCRAMIREQRKLARHDRVPWGVSESAYFELDDSGHYKYYAFGIDSLALRRSARPRYVVSPYASLLALPFAPRKVLNNLESLRAYGCWGRYGLYEALDFGEHPGAEARPRLVQSFMAHHQAMIIAALTNFLCGDSLVRRFHANPEIAAVEHLLYEALPRRAQDRVIRHMPPVRPRVVPLMTSEQVAIPADRVDHFVNVVGNGHLTVRSTGCGSGDISWNTYAITRWHPRTSGPMGGETTYLSDFDAGDLHILGAADTAGSTAPEFWCAAHQTELHQRFGNILARLSTSVAPDNDVALRRITLTNESRQLRRIGLTHYAELVLAPAAEDQRHPAFNKLFIESEFVAEPSALLFSRRRRSAEEAGLCCAVSVVVPDEYKPTLYYTCDRRSFLGRTGSYRKPAALSGSELAFDHRTGKGLDPAAAIGVTIEVPAGATLQVLFITSVSPDRDQALELIDHFRSPGRVNFSIDQARRRAAAELTELSIDSAKIMRLLEVYADLLWPQPLTERAYANIHRTESILGALWSHGISGDYPLCMVRIRHGSATAKIEELLVLQNYLEKRGVPIDIVLADESPASYAEPVRHRLEELIDKYRRPHRRGRAFVLAINNLSTTERTALDAAALVHIDTGAKNGFDLRARRDEVYQDLPDFVPVRALEKTTGMDADAIVEPQLEFDNGYGGIDAESGDYVIRVAAKTPTPAPWINVLANPDFGSIVSESGSSTTWFQNSSEHRLTSWYNDPVLDRSGEALYIRDEETGEFWSPTPWPAADGERYLVRHGAGYSSFEHVSHRVRQRVNYFVDKEQPVKFITLALRNTAARPRRLTVTYFVEWVFGNYYENTSPYIIPEIDDERRTLLARNALPRFGNDRVAFVTSTAPLHGFTTDRREFLGTARDPCHPAALRRIGLSGEIIAGAEPCCAYQVHVDLAAGEEADVTFALGAADNRAAALALAKAVRSEQYVRDRQAKTQRYWRDMLARCRIRTPNKALDHLFNHWLLYQNLAGRLWGRTGLYQAAGGFGFRDQLQDSLALLHVQPELTRAQIIRACSVQFAAGDVLHWWHEDPKRGVRTRCSDDLLWLPYAVSEYLKVTGETGLLDETVPYLAGEPLRADEAERYTEYASSDRRASVYEHCCNAIDARAVTGRNGLPLIGSGDWNDGLNRVGIEGRGESAWLGWFLADVYTRFASIAEQHDDRLRATELMRRRTALVAALESKTWDGAWYLRAFYDDGSSLGASANNECKIDLNAQTWPAITGLASPERARRALDSVDEWLIDEEARLIKLLTPPFDRTLKDPGYIKGYPPGVRENGGQYTHASTWAIWAAVRLERPEQAMHWADLLNPLLRVSDKSSADHYRGEPYVLPGDVCGVAAQTGQAGWTWYTGSAAWLFRIVLEQILGFQPVHGKLELHPCVPRSWSRFSIDYRFGGSSYAIEVLDPTGINESGASYQLDGKQVSTLQLVDDNSDHRVIVSPDKS